MLSSGLTFTPRIRSKPVQIEKLTTTNSFATYACQDSVPGLEPDLFSAPTEGWSGEAGLGAVYDDAHTFPLQTPLQTVTPGSGMFS